MNHLDTANPATNLNSTTNATDFEAALEQRLLTALDTADLKQVQFKHRQYIRQVLTQISAEKQNAISEVNASKQAFISNILEQPVSETDETSTDDLEEVLTSDNIQDIAYLQDLQHKKDLQKHLPKGWVVVTIFGLLAMLMPMCIDMYLGSFPVMSKDFGVEISRVEFSLSVFFIGIAFGQFFWGPISDSWGRRNITIAAIAGLGLTSVCIANIGSLNLLYLFRLFQGFFCAALLVTTVAILRDIYETKEFVRANGLVTVIFFAAPFLAPLIGSIIVKYSSWHYIFYAICFFCVVCLILFIRIPETINPMFKRKLEFKHTVVIMGQILSDARSFWLVAAMSFSSCMIFTYVSMAAGVYQNIYHVSPQHFPFFFMINIIGQSTFNAFNTKLVKKYGPMKLLTFGVLWMCMSSVYNILAAIWGVGFGGIVLGILLSMSASPLIFLNSIALYLEIHYKHSGTATSLVNVARWVLPGVATAIAQRVNPYHGHTMIFLMGVFCILVAISFVMYRVYAKREEDAMLAQAQ